MTDLDNPLPQPSSVTQNQIAVYLSDIVWSESSSLLSFSVGIQSAVTDLASFGLRLHFDSTAVTYSNDTNYSLLQSTSDTADRGFDSILTQGIVSGSGHVQVSDEADADADAATDSFVKANWVSTWDANSSAMLAWPGSQSVVLYDVNFTATDTSSPLAFGFSAATEDLKLGYQLSSSSLQNFTIDVSNVNDKPVITSDSELAGSQGSAFSFTLGYEDIDDGDTHTFGYSQLPDWLGFDDTTGVLSGTPTNDDVGRYEVTLSVTDAGGLSDSRVFTIDVENPFAWIRLFHWDGNNAFVEDAKRTSFNNLSLTDGDESFVDLNYEQPIDFLDLSSWTNSDSVSVRAHTDKSGHISVSDIVSSIQAYLGVGDLSVVEFASADINGDGSIQVSDIVASIQLYLGLSELDGVIQFIDPVSGGRDFSPVIGETLDLTAVLLGDVDGSWSPEII